MNRILRIVIYGVVLFLIYLWISSVAQSCSNKKETSNVKTEDLDPGELSDKEIYDEYFDSDQEVVNEEPSIPDSEEELNYVDEEPSEKEESAVSANTPLDTEDFSDYEEIREAPSSGNSNTSSNSAYTTNENEGKFLVIAGSYLIKENAEKMVKKLNNLGYPDASIINFELSQYHSITAGRYFSYDRAAEIARALQGKGIDCYVHTRK